MGDVSVGRADANEWDRLINKMPHGTVYHTLGWLRALEAAFGLRLRLIEDLRTPSGRSFISLRPTDQVSEGGALSAERPRGAVGVL